MRLTITIILIAIISAIAAYLFPWWAIFIVCFGIAIWMKMGGWKSFLAGFAGIGLLWLTVILLRDIPNEHILSIRMAALFQLPGYFSFAAVTVFVGALIGGLSASAGSLLSVRSK